MLARLAAISLCCTAGVSQAADNGFYLGVGLGPSKFAIAGAADTQDMGYKFTAGFRLLDSFGVEASYADLGKVDTAGGIACASLTGTGCSSNVYVSGRATSAFAVGFLDFPVLDAFAKVGLSKASGKLRIPGSPALNANDSTTDIAWGVGIQAHFLSFAVRAEFEQFKLFNNVKTRLLSASAIYTFL
jgi:OmpA-OmpF porin, OOP family